MAIVPTGITVAYLPQQPATRTKSRCHTESKACEYLSTVSVEIATSSTTAATAASDISLYETLQSIDQKTMLYRADKRQFQPKISLQPDVVEYWSRNAWRNRAVVGDDKYHVLFTTYPDSKLTENRHLKGKVRGDAFVLKLSDKKDGNGLRYYVDCELLELDRGDGLWEDLAGKVERFMEARGRLMGR